MGTSFLMWAQADAPPASAAVLYATGFETDDTPAFVAGDLAGRGGWTVSEGEARVQSAIRAHGSQAVRHADGRFSLSLSNDQPVIWVDGFLLTTGGAGQPMTPAAPAAGVILFSADRGVLALDGDGRGHGVFVAVAGPLPATRFARVSLRVDFESNHYDVWVDGVRRRAGLGFKDDSVKVLSAFERSAPGVGYLDDLSVTTWGLDRDADGDGLADLDEVKLHHTDPLNPDTDGDGAADGAEVQAGTDPRASQSVFALRLVSDSLNGLVLLLPTVSGRQYALQRKESLPGEFWSEVPEFAEIEGDGNVHALPLVGERTAGFYRVVILK